MLCKLHVIKGGVYLGRYRNAGEVLLVAKVADAAYWVKRQRLAPADAATAELLAPLVTLDRHELGRLAGLETSSGA